METLGDVVPLVAPIVHYYYYYLNSLMQGWERAFYAMSVQRPQPHNTNPWEERREREMVKDKKGSSELLRPIKKAWATYLRPASSTTSNTGTATSFHRCTYRGIKTLRYCEVLQRRGA